MKKLRTHLEVYDQAWLLLKRDGYARRGPFSRQQWIQLSRDGIPQIGIWFIQSKNDGGKRIDLTYDYIDNDWVLTSYRDDVKDPRYTDD